MAATKNRELTEKAKIAACGHGADLVAVRGCADLPEHRDDIEEILLGARSRMVMAASQSLSALPSGKNEIAQFDTIHAYGEPARAAHAAARALEKRGGSRSLAVPPFFPLAMRDPKRGMRGEICWRAPATRSGLGSCGEKGLLLTRQYGSAVGLAGIPSEAPPGRRRTAWGGYLRPLHALRGAMPRRCTFRGRQNRQKALRRFNLEIWIPFLSAGRASHGRGGGGENREDREWPWAQGIVASLHKWTLPLLLRVPRAVPGGESPGTILARRAPNRLRDWYRSRLANRRPRLRVARRSFLSPSPLATPSATPVNPPARY